jgi:hypothetical protein
LQARCASFTINKNFGHKELSASNQYPEASVIGQLCSISGEFRA